MSGQKQEEFVSVPEISDNNSPSFQPARQPAALEKRLVSDRKAAANRKNSLKSTGPRTTRGKIYSRKNASKHGFFSTQTLDFAMQLEDPDEYQKHWDDLHAYYVPVGRAEELEVERIAVCWWKIKRLWRYENAAIRVALRDEGNKELSYQSQYCDERENVENTAIQLLERAVERIARTGRISPKLKRELSTMPVLEKIWPTMEHLAREAMDSSKVVEALKEVSAAKGDSATALAAASLSISWLQELKSLRNVSIPELSTAPYLVPDGKAFEKILRWEAALERNLNRSMDRLEHLQRARRGERVRPPVSVHFT